jgi:hypothetical protein
LRVATVDRLRATAARIAETPELAKATSLSFCSAVQLRMVMWFVLFVVIRSDNLVEAPLSVPAPAAFRPPSREREELA